MVIDARTLKMQKDSLLRPTRRYGTVNSRVSRSVMSAENNLPVWARRGRLSEVA